ncbi:MAG: cation:proton antiporter [Acidimicrobiia bacterium]|nr:MAG: cation:proton antiporter [Acidimicrobiia bacterium]
MGLALLLALFFAYALFSRRLLHSSLTGPMIFTIAGVVTGLILLAKGGSIAGLALDARGEAIQILLETTLVIILFSDAVLIDARAVRKEAFLPGRLLGIGLPLTIVAGTAIAMLIFPDLGFWPAVVIAVILAPTDAALGQAVVANEEVPGLVRQGLGVESGLNDGIAVPFLTIAIAGAANEMQNGSEIAVVFLEEIGLAILVGLGIGWLGGLAVRFAFDKGLMGRGWRQVSVVLLALLCFAVADPIGGSGFIAAFVGGLTFGAQVRREYPDICNFSEGIAHVMTMIAFLVFGAFILTPTLDVITWEIVLYAILSLTVIRMIPVALALIGTGLGGPTQVYIGWFGPRGLASLVFMGTVVIDAGPEEGSAIVAVAATTVGLSVLLHGLTAWPASARYAAWFSRTTEGIDAADMVESKEVTHVPSSKLGGRLRKSM